MPKLMGWQVRNERNLNEKRSHFVINTARLEPKVHFQKPTETGLFQPEIPIQTTNRPRIKQGLLERSVEFYIILPTAAEPRANHLLRGD